MGMRLALMESKIALIEIVRQFRILTAPETKVRVTSMESSVLYFMITLKHVIQVILDCVFN